MNSGIGCGILGADASPEPNSKYGGFLDSSDSADSLNKRSVKRRRTSPPLLDDDLKHLNDFTPAEQQQLDSTGKTF
jgi:hypothetical protein